MDLFDGEAAALIEADVLLGAVEDDLVGASTPRDLLQLLNYTTI